MKKAFSKPLDQNFQVPASPSKSIPVPEVVCCSMNIPGTILSPVAGGDSRELVSILVMSQEASSLFSLILVVWLLPSTLPHLSLSSSPVRTPPPSSVISGFY